MGGNRIALSQSATMPDGEGGASADLGHVPEPVAGVRTQDLLRKISSRQWMQWEPTLRPGALMTGMIPKAANGRGRIS